MGGSHASAWPRGTLSECSYIDFVVCGEGEETLIDIIDNANNLEELSKIRGVATRQRMDVEKFFIEDIDEIPMPAWEEFDLSRYPGACPHGTNLELPIISGRGCPFNSVFHLTLSSVFPSYLQYFIIRAFKSIKNVITSSFFHFFE